MAGKITIGNCCNGRVTGNVTIGGIEIKDSENIAVKDNKILKDGKLKWDPSNYNFEVSNSK